MVMIKEACPTTQLVLVGDGEVVEELKEQARRLGMEESITWTGRVPYWEVPVWIGAMNLCVAPFCGDRGETSPVKIFDYLAANERWSLAQFHRLCRHSLLIAVCN